MRKGESVSGAELAVCGRSSSGEEEGEKSRGGFAPWGTAAVSPKISDECATRHVPWLSGGGEGRAPPGAFEPELPQVVRIAGVARPGAKGTSCADTHSHGGLGETCPCRPHVIEKLKRGS